MKKFISILLSAAMALSALSAAAATDSNKVFDFSFKNVPAAELTYTQEISCGEDKLNCWLADSNKTVSIGDYSAVTGESGNSLNMTNVSRLRPMDGNLSGSLRLSMRFYVPGSENIWGFRVSARITDSSNTVKNPALFGVLGNTDFCLRTGNGEWGIANIVGDITPGWNKIDYELMRSSGLANLYINDVQVASNVAANIDSNMTTLLTSDKLIEYIDIWTLSNTGSGYMDSISIEMLNDYSVLSEGMTYTEPKLKLAFDSAVDSLTAEDITITNNNIHKSFKPSAVSKLNESAYEITVPEKEVRPFTEYSIGIQKSGIVKDKIFTTNAIQTKNTLFGCSFDTTDEQNKFSYTGNNGTAAVEAVEGRSNAVHMAYTRQAADDSTEGYKETAPVIESNAFTSKINSKFTLETDIMREDKASSAAIQIRGAEGKYPVLKFDNTGDICTIVNWKKARVLGTYETNKWYHVRIDIDPAAGKETITVTDTVTGNVFMAANTDMFCALTDVSNVGVNIWDANTVGTATGTYIDNVEISDYTALNNRLDINKLMLKQGSTVIKNYCQLLEDVPVEAVVNVTSDKDETYDSVKVILAEYNNGELVAVNAEDALLNKDESGTASHTLETGITTANCAGRSVKAFLWDSFDSMTPYVEAVAFNGKD